MTDRIEQRINSLNKRLNSEKRFRIYCIGAMSFALAWVLILFLNIFSSGYSAFYRTVIQVDVPFLNLIEDTTQFSEMSSEDINNLSMYSFSKKAIYGLFPDIEEKKDKKMLIRLFSIEFEQEIREFLKSNKSNINETETIYLTASDDVDQVNKGNYPRDLDEDKRRIKDIQLLFFDDLVDRGLVSYEFNLPFLMRGDSREPELAGVGGSIVGSLFTILVVLILSFPIGIFAAIYLEEFAPKNRVTDFIEININNLAAVPSIVFGLLGLGIILNTFGLPRSTPLVGGIVLSLMTLPTIIIATRASLRAVPPSIREGALAVGATKMQAVMHHVVPVAMPGALTGTIIGLAQALGETAPLLLIGMVAFVVDVPQTPLDASASLPVQVYLWSESAERGYVEKTSATIMMLLGFLILMNLAAVLIRRKFETKW
ncbi:MAG: phosphate transport system permease protein PstA [Candidatus Pelagibacterales bacterium]|jgi:phosphate transport system permease protein|nr:MAG: phosphate transport system permease protein PstA [Pelagibacterales bacterium]